MRHDNKIDYLNEDLVKMQYFETDRHVVSYVGMYVRV